MKLMVLLEIDVSATLAATIQRSGFVLAPDGTGMQVKIPNSPPIPQRKIQAVFIENPSPNLKVLMEQYARPKGDVIDAEDVSNRS